MPPRRPVSCRWSYWWQAVEKLVTEQMGSAADLSVPLDVQIGVGPSWYDAGH